MERKKTEKGELGVIRVPKSTHEAFKLFANENNLKLSEAADRVLTKSINSDDLLKKNQPIKLVEKVADNTKAVKDLDKMFRSWMRNHEQNEIRIVRQDLKAVLMTMEDYPNAEQFKKILSNELSKLDNSTKAINAAAILTRDKIDELTEENQQLKEKVSSLNTFTFLAFFISTALSVLIFLAVKNVF